MDKGGLPHAAPLSYLNFFDFRAGNHVFEHLVSYTDARFTLTDALLPAIEVPGEIVSWDLIPMLQIAPESGRGFLPDEERSGAKVIVISDQLWRSRFASDPAILKKHIELDREWYRVVGIMPRAFEFPAASNAQIWTTLAKDFDDPIVGQLARKRGSEIVNVVGRLAHGVSIDSARLQMDEIARGLARKFPAENVNIGGTLMEPEIERLTGAVRSPLWLLFWAVQVLLVTACANLGTLSLARNAGRVQEFSMRLALGASRTALAGQVVIESFYIALLGAAGGLLVANVILPLIIALASQSIPRVSEASIDMHVLAYSAAGATFAATLFSFPPLFRITRGESITLVSLNRLVRAPSRLHRALVAAQVSIGLILTIVAVSLMTGFISLAARPTGFRSDDLLTFNTDVSGNAETVSRFLDRWLARLRALPGVDNAAFGAPLPLSGDQMALFFDLADDANRSSLKLSDFSIVSQGYFATMGIPILKGRDFEERDAIGGRGVVIINRAFAEKYFAGAEALGKPIAPRTPQNRLPGAWEIIGIVDNARQEPYASDPTPVYYFLYGQLPLTVGTFVLRTASPPRQVIHAAGEALHKLDPRAAMYDVETGEEISGSVLKQPRFQAVILDFFAALSVLITWQGLYSLLSLLVAARKREIALRVAFGAGRSQILAVIAREALSLSMSGGAIGLSVALFATHFIHGIGLKVVNTGQITIACILMALAAVLATYGPAVRAASVDPARILADA